MKPFAAAGVRLALISLASLATRVPAQVPSGAASLNQAAVSDSQRVLAELRATIAKNPNDAEAWLRQGMVAWALFVRAGVDPQLKGLDAIALRRLSDTSLIIAGELGQQNARLLLDAGELLRTATALGPRVKAAKYLDGAYTLSKSSEDASLHARAALAVGRLAWLSYEVNANQLLRMRCKSDYVMGTDSTTYPELGSCPSTPCYDLGPTVDSAAQRYGAYGSARTNVASTAAAKAVHNQLTDCLDKRSPPVLGDYQKAEFYFREAYAKTPADQRAFRNLSMLRAERNRWTELAAVARDRTTRAADDPWTWLTLGLALHRLRDTTAGARLERGLALMTPDERGRLFAFSKLLDRFDSVSYVATDANRRDSHPARALQSAG